MNAHLLLNRSLAVVALISCHASGQTISEFKEWDSIVAATAGQILPDGSNSSLTLTSNFTNANPGKALSLGVFKSGSVHRVRLQSLGGGGSASAELTFSLGWYVPWDWVQFHTQQIYGDNSTCKFYWAPTYNSGVMNYGEMELFVLINPQTAGYQCKVQFYGNQANWVSPQGKTGIPSNQLPLNEVIASQTSYSFGPDNWVYLNGNQVQANGSNILTEATAPGFLGGSGFLQSSGFNSALASSTPPSSSTAWKNAFVPRGNVSGGGVVAAGTGSYAAGTGSVALGDSSIAYHTGGVAFGGGNASGEYATAMSWGITTGYLSFASQGAMADGTSAIALGGYEDYYGGMNFALGGNSTAIGGVWNEALGFSSFASGNRNVAQSAYSVALGSMSIGRPGSSSSWVETDSLFELGNGYSTTIPTPTSVRSNAITTLKNGQTTLTNKAWQANSGHPLDDPGTTSDGDSGGEALVVDGHTRLRGKVIIEEPQGNISMGIYE